MRELVFATGNANKLKEINLLIGHQFKIKSLADIGFNDEIPEPYDTIEENAAHKAKFFYKRYQVDCFAEDTGLIIPALNGKPGVLSARYAGEQKSATDNMQKVLSNLKDKEDWSAYFKTVVALIINGEIHLFEGTVNGKITAEAAGSKGFGYDPIFYYPPKKCTFAQLKTEEKSEISHRGAAIRKLAAYLLTL